MLSKERLEIRHKCEHDNNGMCNICGCILKAKVRSIFPLDDEGISVDGCPERKW